MPRKICITEEQYTNMLKEGVLPNGKIEIPVSSKEIETSGFNNAADKIRQGIETKLNLPSDKVDNSFEITAPASEVSNPSKTDKIVSVDKNSTSSESSSIWEGRLITKSDLIKHRLKVLKENSEVYSVKDFMKLLKKEQ